MNVTIKFELHYQISICFLEMTNFYVFDQREEYNTIVKSNNLKTNAIVQMWGGGVT